MLKIALKCEQEVIISVIKYGQTLILLALRAHIKGQRTWVWRPLLLQAMGRKVKDSIPGSTNGFFSSIKFQIVSGTQPTPA